MWSSLRVLIVEDELLIADYLSTLIEDAEHQVVDTCAIGAGALAILERGNAWTWSHWI